MNGTGPKDEVASKPATAEADNSTATDDMVRGNSVVLTVYRHGKSVDANVLI